MTPDMTENSQDRLLIRERYSAYSDSAFQQDMDAWLANWTDDGIWFVFGKEICGKQALTQQWQTLWADIRKMAFFSEIGAMHISDNQASVRSYCREIVVLKSGDVIKVVAQYDDILIKQHDQWLFKERRYSVLIHET